MVVRAASKVEPFAKPLAFPLSVILNLVPGIEPATSRSGVKRSIDWDSLVAVIPFSSLTSFIMNVNAKSPFLTMNSTF